ncbi:MAG: hypothetical protein AB1486_11430 [Planctomycetota bacterium]
MLSVLIALVLGSPHVDLDPLQASAPRLVRSEPESGAEDVAPDIGVIRFHFDRPMKTTQWTLWQSDRGLFPPMTDDNEAPWRDAKCCELRIQKLEPGTTYAIQLNSDRRQGFQAADGDVALPVTVVVFKTRSGTSKHPAKDDAQREPPPRPQDAPRRVNLPTGFTTYRCIDEGGLQDPSSGQYLEAFRLLIPKGWRLQGGPQWVYHQKAPQQLTRADILMPVKTAFTVSSPDNRCVLRAYPEERWVDPSRTPAAMMGVAFPPGSEYNGMIVNAPLSPQRYILDYVLPRQRGVTGARITKQEDSPDLARLFQAEAETVNRILGGFSIGGLRYQAGLVEVDYEQGGQPFHEAFVCALQFLETEGLVMWWPRMNVSGQAPSDEYEAWRPYFVSMLTSFRANTRWIVRLQALNNDALKGIQDLDAYCRKIDQEIVENRQHTNAAIQDQMQSVLMPWHDHKAPDGQTYYLDPQQKHSINERGEIVSGDKFAEGPGWSKLELVEGKAEK